ncbi:hypothetical protein [Nonomuraea sp. bgisy101]|uniref:hypothetical protein n=1 Tax=Nonomuraea sp. bgisy101 TaxID=3413784 RepID=UPI003D74F084
MRTPGLLPLRGATKSGRKRIVSLDDGTIAVLRNQHRMQTVGPERRGDDGYVFTTGWGEPVHLTRPRSSGPARPSTSSRPASATPTRPSHCVSTLT